MNYGEKPPRSGCVQVLIVIFWIIGILLVGAVLLIGFVFASCKGY